MKKRTIVFLLVLSALLGALGVSCAYAAESYPDEFYMLCFVCKSEQLFFHMGYIEVDLEGEYAGQKGHVAVNRCTKCLQDDIQLLDARPHKGTATCTTPGICTVCGRSYTLPHTMEYGDPVSQKATCTEDGYKNLQICKICGYKTYTRIPAQHVLWPVAGKAATCTESGWETYEKCNNMGCETVACRLLMMEAEDYAVALCPICGAVSDGVQLALAGEAAAKAERLPRGELVVRLGTLQNGERMLSVAFEYAGKLTRPAGPVQITLPAALLEGYALHALAADGTETALPIIVTGEDAAFTLRFDAQDEIPARLLRLVPAV